MLQSMGLQRVGQDWATEQQQNAFVDIMKTIWFNRVARVKHQVGCGMLGEGRCMERVTCRLTIPYVKYIVVVVQSPSPV